MIELGKFDSALVYFAKGWYDTGKTNEEYYESLRRIYCTYYFLSDAEDRYIAEHLYELCTDTLKLFDNSSTRYDFLSGIAPGGKYGCWDEVIDLPEPMTFITKRDMISYLWKLHWKNVIHSCLSILSTLQILDTDKNTKEEIVLIKLCPCDYTILHNKRIVNILMNNIF